MQEGGTTVIYDWGVLLRSFQSVFFIQGMQVYQSLSSYVVVEENAKLLVRE